MIRPLTDRPRDPGATTCPAPPPDSFDPLVDVVEPLELREPPDPIRLPALRFAPLAWLKLQYLCHAGGTEVGAFGVSAAADPLYVERVETVMQGATAARVEFSDTAVADHFDRFADLGVPPGRCGRLWIHTHPGSSPEPS